VSHHHIKKFHARARGIAASGNGAETRNAERLPVRLCEKNAERTIPDREGGRAKREPFHTWEAPVAP